MPFRGDRVTRLREALGLSQEELADKVKTSQKQISKYESGAEPGSEKLMLLAKALNTTSDYLLGLTDYPDRPIRGTGDLDTREIEAIQLLRNADPETRQKIINALKALV